MTIHRISMWVAIMGLVCLGWGVARAEPKPEGTVTGHGIVELKRQPEYLRVHVDLLARGKDVNEALIKLRERRHAAQKHLEQFGGAAAIEFAKPTIVEEKNDRQQRQMIMMMRQMNQAKKPAQRSKEPPPTIVSCTLKAEIKLKAGDPEELLSAAHSLEEAIKLADLGGIKDLKHASPQDEEQEQEEAAEMMNFGNSEAPKRGEPVFSYVSKISDDDQMKARAEAFKKAHREASRLAKAAGVELGPIYHLEDNSASTNPWDESINYIDSSYSSHRWQQLLSMRGAGNLERASSEAIGLQPTTVVYRVALSASFELKTPNGK